MSRFRSVYDPGDAVITGRFPVVAADIANGAVIDTKLATDAVTPTKIQALAVTTGKLADDAVTSPKAATGVVDGDTITGAVLQTAASGERIVIRNDGSGGIIESYTGLSGETPGVIDPSTAFAGFPTMTIRPGTTATRTIAPTLILKSAAGGPDCIATIYTTNFNVVDPTGTRSAIFTIDNGVVQTVTLGGDLAVSGHATYVGTGWTTFPLRANYVAFGAGYQTPQYKRVGNTVYLRGTMTRNTSTAAAGSVCGDMPVGARPTGGTLMFVSQIGNVVNRTDIATSGTVIHAVVALTVGGFFGLDGTEYAID